MKKAVVLGMILLALGTLAYADASIGFGWGRTTFTVASGQSGTGASTDILTGWGIPDFPPAPRENLDIAYSGDHTAFHFTAFLDGTALSWTNIYGTLKLMPDMFSVMIGQFNGDGFDAFRKTSPHPLRDENNGNVGRFNGYGIILDIAPKDSGFEAAVMIKTGDPSAIPTNFADPLNLIFGSPATGSPATISDTFTNTNVGLSYTVPNAVKVAVGSTTAQVYHASRNVFGRVEVLMVPSLTLWADVKYAGFDIQPTAQSIIDAELAAAYDMKPLTIVFAGKFGMSDATGTSVTTWSVYPEVYYNLGAITLGLYAKVNGDSVANSGIGYGVEPYFLLNDFNTRISFMYTGSTATGVLSTWRIPIIINWGF